MSVIDFILTIFLPQLYHKFLDVLFAPFYYPDMIWIIIPLVISVLLMELYFGRYPREEMGYHMALENTVFLLFVSGRTFFIWQPTNFKRIIQLPKWMADIYTPHVDGISGIIFYL